MSWLVKKGINLRATLAFVSDPAGTVCLAQNPAAPLETPLYTPSGDSNSPLSLGGDSFNAGWVSHADGARDRLSSGVDARLAGIQCAAFGSGVTSNTFELQCGTAPGQYKIWLGICDQGNGSPGAISVAISDAHGLLTTVTHAQISGNQVVGADGTLYANGAAWAATADGSGNSITITTTDTSNANGGPLLSFLCSNNCPLAHVAVQFTPTAAALAGSGSSTSQSTGALSTGIKLAGTPSSVSTAVGNLMGLAANAASASTGVGALTTAIQLAAAASSASIGSAALANAIAIAGAASSASTAAATLTNWATVTLAAPLYTGIGSVLDPHFWIDSVPTVGTTLFYDATNITIQTDGEIVSTTNNCIAVVQFFDGTSWALGIVILTPNMVGQIDLATFAAGALSTSISLVSAAASLVSAAGSLNTSIRVSGAAVSVASAAAALAAQIVLAAAALDASTGSGTLSGTNQALSGNAASTTNATGVLSTQIQMAAAATSLVSALGALATHIQLVSAALSVTSGAGTLITATQLAGAISVASVASGALVTGIRISAAAIEATVAAASLSTQIRLLGAAVAATVGTGALSANVGLAAAASSISTATASLTTLIAMHAAAFTQSDAEGQLLTGIVLQGGALDTDSATGALSATGSPVGIYTSDPFFVIAHRRQTFTTRFPEVSPGSSDVLTFDFSDELIGTETLEGIISVNLIASAGADGSAPGNILNGVAAYDPTLSEVLQPFHNVLQDVDYYFTVTAPTTNPNKTLTRFGLLSVRG